MLKLTMSHLTQASRVAGAVLILLSLSLSHPGTVSHLQAQSPSNAKASSPPGGPKEGIKVHGRWTIDIRNPEGKLVSHHEFENALGQGGILDLGSYLRRGAKAGEWMIELGSNVSSLGPCENVGNPFSCVIYEPASNDQFSTRSYAFKNLTIGIVGNGATILGGTATAQRDGQITDVATFQSKCGVETQGVCAPSLASFRGFSSKTLPAPISVVTGQIIQVTVVISFS